MKQILKHHAELRFWMLKQCVGENEKTRLSFRLQYYICGTEMRNRENSEMRTFHEKWNRKMYTKQQQHAHTRIMRKYVHSSITKQPKVEESQRHTVTGPGTVRDTFQLQWWCVLHVVACHADKLCRASCTSHIMTVMMQLKWMCENEHGNWLRKSLIAPRMDTKKNRLSWMCAQFCLSYLFSRPFS